MASNCLDDNGMGILVFKCRKNMANLWNLPNLKSIQFLKTQNFNWENIHDNFLPKMTRSFNSFHYYIEHASPPVYNSQTGSHHPLSLNIQQINNKCHRNIGSVKREPKKII